MVTLQILVLSFLVRIQVAQQSGRFSIAFFVVCELGARGSFRPAWCAECVPRGKALPCHLRCREFREFKEFRERCTLLKLSIASQKNALQNKTKHLSLSQKIRGYPDGTTS